jgi:DNA-binding transcriptional MerR regulator
MPTRSRINYNPSLSIKQNADRCGVTEAAIRKYINEQGIDRRYDEQVKRYNAVKVYVQSHKDAKPSEVAKALNMSLNTVKKYMAMESVPVKPNTDKISKVNLSKLTAPIKTVDKDQTAILSGILRLYCDNAPTFDCDLTISVGGFYNFGIPRPAHLFDKYPVSEDVRPLENAESLPEGCFKSIVIDLPFMVEGCPTEKSLDSIMLNRFSSFRTNEELYATNSKMIELAYRLLAPKGILVMKTQDYWKQGRQEWVAHYIINEAYKLGFELLDQFLLIAKTKLLKPAYRQLCARKMHSYFLVFRKP